MKKILLSLGLLLGSFSCLFATTEPLLVIKPFHEVFLNFPSSSIESADLAVTVFLPKRAVPLSGKYPVVYMLGVDYQQAEAVQKLLEESQQKALLVGVSWGEKEPALGQIIPFVARELVPYIDANYPTIDEPEFRAIAVQGDQGAAALKGLLARKNLFTKAVLLGGEKGDFSLQETDSRLRFILAGPREMCLQGQKVLQEKSYRYGVDFVTYITPSAVLTDIINPDYLFAKAEDITVEKLQGNVFPDVLHINQPQSAYLAMVAQLKNGLLFDYIPTALSLNPSYLQWNANQGTLTLKQGAKTGRVKINVFVDKVGFKKKIRLKK